MTEANRSKRREGFEQNAPGHPIPHDHSSFCYEPLHPHNDSLRLLTIEPAELDAHPLVCSLSVVEFGDKPIYEALSYMWGSDTSSQLPVTVNSQKHNVGKNLWDALHYLRRQGKKRQIWIDALCINQNDIPERNRQLRIMHHIYFRAAVVIVWLGAAYSRYHDIVQHMQNGQNQADQERVSIGTYPPPTPGLEREGADTTGISQEEVGMVEELYNDEYWRRLWIVQEVGQADHLQVCFGRSAPLAWEAFIHLITMHNKGTEGPIKLDELRRSRSNGGFKLRSLLWHHRHANCKEPRDKVYGLIGLADDAHRFPMDYSKTLIEVWTDVMHFTWQRGLLRGPEVITFGALVKLLLMGNQCTPLQQVLRPHSAEQDPALQRPGSNKPVVFEIQGAVLGVVGFVGASTTDIVRKLSTVDEWNGRVQEAYSEEVESAGSESRTLVRSLLSPGQTRRCFNHVSAVGWKVCCNWGSEARSLHSNLFNRPQHMQGENDMISVEEDRADDDPHVFQFQNQYNRVPWKMGISCSHTRRGDLLVWILGIPAAILLRPTFIKTEQAELRINGTAWVTEDVARKRTSHSDHMATLKRPDHMTTIKMDATTVFVLLAHRGEDYV